LVDPKKIAQFAVPQQKASMPRNRHQALVERLETRSQASG
jgi:hypothetical protein